MPYKQFSVDTKPPHLIKNWTKLFRQLHSNKKTRSFWNNGYDISWLHVVYLFKDHCSGVFKTIAQGLTDCARNLPKNIFIWHYLVLWKWDWLHLEKAHMSVDDERLTLLIFSVISTCGKEVCRIGPWQFSKSQRNQIWEKPIPQSKKRTMLARRWMI